MLTIAQKSVHSNYKDYWYVSFVDTALTFQEIENRIMPGSKDIIKESTVFVSNRNQLKLKSVWKHLTQDARSVHQRLTQYFWVLQVTGPVDGFLTLQTITVERGFYAENFVWEMAARLNIQIWSTERVTAVLNFWWWCHDKILKDERIKRVDNNILTACFLYT